MDGSRGIGTAGPQTTAMLMAFLLSAVFVACGGGGGSATQAGGQATSASGGKAGAGASSAGGIAASGGVAGKGGVSGQGGSGGMGGYNQTAGTGAGGACASVTPCGGDVFGTWTVTSSCLTMTGALDPSAFGLSCSVAPVTGALHATGTWTAKSGGTTYADNTITSGTVQFTLPKACLVYSSTGVGCDQAASIMKGLGSDNLTCNDAADGGCSCSGTIQQTGGIGRLSADLSATGKYKTSSNVVTLTGDTSVTDLKYSYCVSGSSMTWTPQGENPTLTGTVVFQKGGAAGSGGAGGGGTTGSGGRTGSGGTSAATGTSAPGGSTGSGGAGAGGSTGGSAGPCDVLAAASTPCVAAHSTVRALFAGYSKPLYQVKKVSDGSTKDISLLAGTGIADASAQDAFCGTTSKACTISIIYDQTGNGNDLKVAKMCSSCSGCPGDGSKKGQPDVEAFADGAKITIGGHTAYGVRILPCGGGIPNQTGYRCTTPNKTATGDQPESAYFVVDGVNNNSGCCFDYGNANPEGTASGNMDAVYFGSYGVWGSGAGSGPWVGADLEAGIYTWNGKSGNWKNPNSLSLKFPFVTALVKNNQNGKTAEEGPFALKGGDARSGALTTMWSGARPDGYATLDKKGGIVMGIGGDGAAGAAGNFFEGAITASFNSKATDDALQANIVAAGYGK